MIVGPLVIDVVLAGGLVVGYLPPPERLERAAAALEASGKVDDASRIRDVDRQIRENPNLGIERREYSWQPYTYGDELQARRSATTVTDRGSHFDPDAYHIALVSKCLGSSPEDVLKFEPALFAAIRYEIACRCNPSEESLLFFALPPMTSPGAKPSNEAG